MLGRGRDGSRVDEGAPLAVAAVVLRPVELLAELGFVILRYIVALLKFVAAVGKRALK